MKTINFTHSLTPQSSFDENRRNMDDIRLFPFLQSSNFPQRKWHDSAVHYTPHTWRYAIKLWYVSVLFFVLFWKLLWGKFLNNIVYRNSRLLKKVILNEKPTRFEQVEKKFIVSHFTAAKSFCFCKICSGKETLQFWPNWQIT